MPDDVKGLRRCLYNFSGFIALSIAYFVAYKFRFGEFKLFEDQLYVLTYGLIVLFWFIVCMKIEVNFESNEISKKDIIIVTLKRVLWLFIYISCIDFVAKLELSRIYTGVFIILCFLLGILLKFLCQKIDKILFGSYLKDYHCVIIGTKEVLNSYEFKNIVKEFEGKSEFIVLDNEKKDVFEYATEKLRRQIKNSIVDEVILLAEFDLNNVFVKQVIEICKITGRKLKIMYKNNMGFENARLNINENCLTLEFQPIKFSFLYRFVKRLVDIVISTIALIVLSPLFLLIAILIKIDSPDGPVFFIQERVGLNGRRFKLIKFRTMIPDADKMKEQLMKYNEMDGPVFKITNDPRITRVGRVLRKLNLDELPQLINVLKGEMSLVGPRPLETREALGCEFEHHIRHSVKPGLTCIWQATHNRNDVGYSEWMRMDYEYIIKKNFLLDVILIFKTLVLIFKLNGR